MKNLPDNVVAYKRTPEFTETSVPDGLLKDHQTKTDVWGKIVVLEGSLQYIIIEPTLEILELNEHRYGVVEPTIIHHVKPMGKIRFYVEFYH